MHGEHLPIASEKQKLSQKRSHTFKFRWCASTAVPQGRFTSGLVEPPIDLRAETQTRFLLVPFVCNRDHAIHTIYNASGKKKLLQNCALCSLAPDTRYALCIIIHTNDSSIFGFSLVPSDSTYSLVRVLRTCSYNNSYN